MFPQTNLWKIFFALHINIEHCSPPLFSVSHQELACNNIKESVLGVVVSHLSVCSFCETVTCVLGCCLPSALKFGILRVLWCFSAPCGCNEWLFEVHLQYLSGCTFFLCSVQILEILIYYIKIPEDQQFLKYPNLPVWHQRSCSSKTHKELYDFKHCTAAMWLTPGITAWMSRCSF